MFRGDPLRLRPPSKEFQCYESLLTKDQKQLNYDEDDDDDDDDLLVAGKGILFHCTLPQDHNNTTTNNNNKKKGLEFWCRGPSVDVLLTDEKEENINDDDDEDGTEIMVDPNFFDKGYTLAGRTGFQVWPGTRLLVEALTFINDNDSNQNQQQQQQLGDCPKLVQWQKKIDQLRILELGAGVGVVGTSLAAAGAQVLLTDLSTLVDCSIWPNLKRNANLVSNNSNDDDESSPQVVSPPPLWLQTSSSTQQAVAIGKGYAAAASVDWTQPLTEQLDVNGTLQEINVIVASDCVWLISMLNPLLDTVQTVFDNNKDTVLLMSFQRRDPKTTTSSNNNNMMFTTVDGIIEEMQVKRNWNVDCLSWRPVNPNEDDKEVFLFEVSPR